MTQSGHLSDTARVEAFSDGVFAIALLVLEIRTLAVAAYSATLVVIALAYNALWWYAAAGPISYAVSLGLALVNVWASLAVQALLAALYLLPEHARVVRASSS